MKLQLDRNGASGSLVSSLATGADASPAIRVAAVVFIAAATAAAAQISVPLPFTPVPFAMQDMVVLIGGAALGSRLGMAAQLLYLAAGIAGLPVFAASAVLPQGALRLLGPTGGYLLSYPVAAYLTGRLAERGFDRLVELCRCEGQVVKAGQILGRQDDAEERSALDQMEINRGQLERDLVRAE